MTPALRRRLKDTEFKVSLGYVTVYRQKTRRQCRAVSSLALSEGLTYVQPERIGERGKVKDWWLRGLPPLA